MRIRGIGNMKEAKMPKARRLRDAPHFNDLPVEVRLMQRIGLPKANKYYFEVLVRSSVRRFHKMKGIIEHEPTNQSEKIGYLAGYLAEEMADRYEENRLDPSDCARAAIEAYLELMAENPQVGIGDEIPRDADTSILARN